MSIATTAYVAQTEGAIALAAATPKTVLSVIAASGKGFKVSEVSFGFDGVTASAVPVLVELCRSTQAGAGTSTSVTPRLVSGKESVATQVTAAKNYTAEPTVLTPIREWLLSPNSGLLIIPAPLGREQEPAPGNAIALRMTAPAAVNTRAYIEYEE